MNVENKTIMITDANRGIGWFLVLGLWRASPHCILAYLRHFKGAGAVKTPERQFTALVPHPAI